jgi:(p)ppGpp synthase/HD superfamily hydrolase
MIVATLVIEHGDSEEQAIAALLHDAAEDHGGVGTLGKIKSLFGEAVAERFRIVLTLGPIQNRHGESARGGIPQRVALQAASPAAGIVGR